jgi:hypothetical protein
VALRRREKQVLVEAFWIFQNLKSFDTPGAGRNFKTKFVFFQSQTKTSAKTCITNPKQK